MKWQDKLTKAEFKHLRETTSLTLTSFRRNYEAHEAERRSGGIEPCWTCKTIARKLGWPVSSAREMKA